MVLKKPDDVSATADWFWDDPYYPDRGVFLIDYNSYIQNNLSKLVACNDEISGGNDSRSFIASVESFVVTREKLGSYGLRNYRTGEVEGLLVHTPFISPAIFGTVTLGR